MAKVSGAVRHTARLRNSSVAAADFVEEALKSEASKLEVDAEISITTNSSSSPHVPSLPGQPPNEDTGVLAGNIESLRTTVPGLLRYTVSSNAKYAAFLEFGTSRMQARPYMRPALQRRKDSIIKRIAAAINQANRMK